MRRRGVELISTVVFIAIMVIALIIIVPSFTAGSPFEWIASIVTLGGTIPIGGGAGEIYWNSLSVYAATDTDISSGRATIALLTFSQPLEDDMLQGGYVPVAVTSPGGVSIERGYAGSDWGLGDRQLAFTLEGDLVHGEDEVTIEITDTITAADGAEVSSGSCTDMFEDTEVGEASASGCGSSDSDASGDSGDTGGDTTLPDDDTTGDTPGGTTDGGSLDPGSGSTGTTTLTIADIEDACADSGTCSTDTFPYSWLQADRWGEELTIANNDRAVIDRDVGSCEAVEIELVGEDIHLWNDRGARIQVIDGPFSAGETVGTDNGAMVMHVRSFAGGESITLVPQCGDVSYSSGSSVDMGAEWISACQERYGDFVPADAADFTGDDLLTCAREISSDCVAYPGSGVISSSNCDGNVMDSLCTLFSYPSYTWADGCHP